MKRHRHFRDKPRGVVSRKRKPVIFLSLEGKNKTERLYLFSLNRDYGNMFVLRFISGHETDIKRMLCSLQNQIKDTFRPNDGDKAYCVCDRDCEGYKLDHMLEAKREAHGTPVNLIISNPCFEIWLLNHFQYSTRSYLNFQELKNELCRYIPCYQKNNDYYASHLKGKTVNAIRNSIQQIVQVNQSPADFCVINNPGTEIYEIVQTIIQA